MRKEYVEQRPTVIMPGSGGTVAGTAVNEWLDDDGNPKFEGESESAGDKSEARTQKPAGPTTTSHMTTRSKMTKKRNERIRKAHDEAQDDQAQNDDAARDDDATTTTRPRTRTTRTQERRLGGLNGSLQACLYRWGRCVLN